MNETDKELTAILNQLLVKLFKEIVAIEEKAIQTGEYKDVTTNDMHVIEAIGNGSPKNMSSVAKTLSVTMGTLTISVNSLVKKGFVQRERSEEDRRVVLVSLTESGRKAFKHHKQFHDNMIEAVIGELSQEEQEIMIKTLTNLNGFFNAF